MSVASILSQYTDETNPSQLTGVPLEVLMSLINGKSEKKGKSKKVKDPNRPKRPLNACFLWMADGNRDKIKSWLASSEKPCKMPDVTREAGKQWKELSEDEKRPYVESAASALATWKEAMSEYKPVEVSTSVSDKLPVGGEMGYSTLYENQYLPRYVKGENGKKMVYADLESAIRASMEIEECGGITAEKGKKSWRYTLRTAGVEDLKESRKGEGSWVKVDGGAPAPVKSKVETDSGVRTGLLSGAGMPDGIEEEVLAKVSEEQVEVEVENDEDGSDEECEVEEFEHNGKTYVYDEDGNIYDPEGDGDVIGKYVDGVAQW
tara:strand:+ start:220 stop:1179 length:960 start_codon:yes stop_codon:yes gene_type:complete